MDEAMVTTLIVYWLAHVYIKTVSERRPGSTTPLHRLLRHSARDESPILLGGLPAVVLTTVLALAQVSLWATVLAVLVAAIVVLVLEGALAGLKAGMRGSRLAVEAGSAAVMGVILAALLVSLHVHCGQAPRCKRSARNGIAGLPAAMPRRVPLATAG